MLNILGNWVHRYFSDEEAVLLLIFLVLALVITFTIGPMLTPVLASIVIAFLMQGLVIRLRRFGVPHTIAVAVTFVVLMAFVVSAFIWVLPVLWHQLRGLLTELPRMLSELQRILVLLPERYPTLISNEQVEEILDLARAELGTLGQSLLTISLANAPVLLAVLIYLVLVPILVFFFLKDSHVILAWLSSFLPKRRPTMTRIWTEMNQQIANYVRGKVIEIFIVGASTYVVFALLGVNFALLLGIAVGLSVVIPFIGSAVVSVPVAIIGYTQFGWSSEFLWVMVAYLVIQGLDGNVLVPLLFSEAVNLHPIAIILAVVIFGGLWGFWGVFLAIPLATFIKAIVYAWPQAGAIGAVGDEL